jgi:hypothetical protein
MANELNIRNIVQNLLNAAASQAPGGIGKVLQLIINDLIFPKFLDGWLFPKPETDIFKQFEERIEKMIDKQVEAAIGQATFDRVKARLVGLADAFKGFANVVDFEERRVRMGYLLTLADATVAEVEAVPNRYLYSQARSASLCRRPLRSLMNNCETDISATKQNRCVRDP